MSARRALVRLPRGSAPAPAWAGAGIALGLLALFIAVAWASGGLATVRAGQSGLWEYREIRMALLVAFLAGYLPTARRYVALGAARNLADLLPLVGSAEGNGEAFAQRFLRLDAGATRLAGALGLLIVPITALAIDRDPGLYLRPGYWGPEVAFAWVVGAFVGWSFGRFVYDTLAYAGRFSHLAGEIERIDLFAPGELAPFARQGLRSALLWLILLSSFSLNALDLAWFAATTALALAGGIAALILPVRGVHLRLRATKRTELGRVHAAIRGDSTPLARSPIAARAESLGLADLLAYRQFVESVREWPFDSPTLLRFALYLAIPLGSWLGGALVERLLGAALD